MNRISPASRLVSTATMSPVFSSAGPEVCFMYAFISLPMMLASVVLPRPGGPKSRT